MTCTHQYLYPNADLARREFARAWVTGNGLHSSTAVTKMVESIEDTAEDMATVATHLGDRHQAATTPQEWQSHVCEAALEYWQEYKG